MHRQKRVAPQAYLSQIAHEIILPVQADWINGMIQFKPKLAQKVGKLFSMM